MEPELNRPSICASEASDAGEGWDTMTGWRLIAEEVMKEADGELGSAIDSEEDHDQTPLPLRAPPMTELSMDRARIQSIVAKAGDSFYTDYQLMENIGCGAFGRAMKAKRRSDQEVVVVKELLVGQMSESERAETKNEVKVLAHLSHPNVVKYYDFYSDQGRMHIVMEHCEEGDLAGYLKKQDSKHLSENEIMLKFVQICLALQNVHSKGILHRDLKTQNIFLTSKGIVKLGDFGISKVLGADQAMARSMVGTPYYLSPEMCEDKPYGPKSDVWALGCVLYELCTLRHAFDGGSLPALVIKILSGKFPPVPDQYSDNLKKLVETLLAKDPTARPFLDDVLNYDYVRTHMKRYAAHIHFCVERRRESFKRSLQSFGIEDPEPGTRNSCTEEFGGFDSRIHPVAVPDLTTIDEDQELVLQKTESPNSRWLDIEEDDDADEAYDLDVSSYRNLSQDVEPNNYEVNIMGGRSSEAPMTILTPLIREHSEAKDKLRALKDKLLGRKSMSSKSSDDSWIGISTPDEDWNGEIYSNPIASEIEAPDADPTETEDVLEDSYETDKEDNDSLDDSDGSEDDFGIDASNSFDKASERVEKLQNQAPRVIAQMNQILSHPPTGALPIGPFSTSSEHEATPLKSQDTADSLLERAQNLRERAETLLGKHNLENIIAFITGEHSVDDDNQYALERMVGKEKVQYVELVYKMLQVQSIYDHLTEGEEKVNHDQV